MKKPTWITVVGVLGIVFGIFGLIGSGQVAAMPTFLQWQRRMFDSFPVAPAAADQQNLEQFQQAMRMFLGDQPSWFGPACIALGVIGLAINGLYVFAGVSLLQLKPNSARLFSRVLGASIALGIVRALVMMNGYSFMAIPMLMSGLVGVVLDVILLVVIVTSDKSTIGQPATA